MVSVIFVCTFALLRPLERRLAEVQLDWQGRSDVGDDDVVLRETEVLSR